MTSEEATKTQHRVQTKNLAFDTAYENHEKLRLFLQERAFVPFEYAREAGAKSSNASRASPLLQIDLEVHIYRSSGTRRE